MAAPHPLTILKYDDRGDCLNMGDAVKCVEEILKYKFADKKLLEMALTHSSYTNAVPYQRIELVGDHVLGLAICSHGYKSYPHHDQGDLSLFISANVSTEKLARVAVRNGLYKYVRHNSAAMYAKVEEFVKAVQEEKTTVIYGGVMRAPKILADIVESVVAAVYVDQDFELKPTWGVVRELLEPLITMEMLQKQPQPVSKLFDSCQKNRQELEIKQLREDDKNTASVYINKKLVVSVSSDQKDNAKLQAATAALEKVTHPDDVKVKHPNEKIDIISSLHGTKKIGLAKRKLQEISIKKKWSRQTYRIVKETGPDHARIYVCSVSLSVDDNFFCEEGEEKSKLKDAEGSAALAMLRGLQEKNLL